MRSFLIMVAIIFALVFTGCGGGGENSSSSQSLVTGVAQLGYISDGTVNLYEKDNLTEIIATTKTSTSINIDEAGSFTFEDIDLDSSKYYVLEVVGGYDIDSDDDGEIDDTPQELKGKIYSLVQGKELLTNQVRVTALSDMTFLKLKDGISTMDNNKIKEFLDKNANEYLYDINEDGVVDSKDLVFFNPVSHRAKTKKSYHDILDIYIPKLHSGEDESSKISSLLYLDQPKIVVKNGNIQEIPFNLETSVENLPNGVDVKWTFDKEEKTSLNEKIEKDGIYTVYAKLYLKDKLLKTVYTNVVATTKTEIATLQTDISKDSIITITDEDSGKLKNTSLIIPESALDKDVEITIKKSSINYIPQEKSSISISDVISFEPSGLTFKKPVQIKLPYDESIDLENAKIRIVRYSNGVVDYLEPLYVDKINHEIVFETEHFTTFEAEINFFGNSEDEKFINALNQLFPDYKRDINEWKNILNVPLKADIVKDEYSTNLIVYDYLKTFIENIRIYEIIKENAIYNESDGTLTYNKYYDYPYISALNYLYPSAVDSSEAMTRWNDIKKGFEYINIIQNTGSIAISLVNGQLIKSLFQLKGIPVDASSFSFYDPLVVGTSFIKSVVNLENNRYISALIYSVYMDKDGVFSYENELEATVEEFLEGNNIKWKAEDLARRYRSFNKEDKLKESQELIELAIKYLDDKNELDKAKENPKAEFEVEDYTSFITTKIGEETKVNFVINTKGVDIDSISFKVYDASTGKVILEDNQIKSVSNDDTDDSSIYGTFETELTFDIKESGKYYISMYISKTVFDKTFDKKEIFINIIEPERLSMPRISHNVKLDENKDYQVNLSAIIVPIKNILYDMEVTFKGEKLDGKDFIIKKDDIDNSELSNLEVKVKIDERMDSIYDIEDKTFTFDLKSIINEIVPDELTCNDNQKLVDGECIAKTCQSDSYNCPVCTLTQTLKYNSDGSGYCEDNTSEPTNTRPVSTSQTLSVKENQDLNITLSGTDADGDTLTYQVGNPTNGTLSGTAPNLVYTPNSNFVGSDSFTFTVNDGQINSAQTTVSITVNKVIRKQISFVSETAPKDNSVVQRGSAFSKTWTFKNSGNIDLNSLSVKTIQASTGFEVSTSSNISSSLKQSKSTSYTLSFKVPNDIAEGTYSATYEIQDSTGALKYANSNSARFSYTLKVEKPNDLKAIVYASSKIYSLGEKTLLSAVINDGNKPYAIKIDWGDGSSFTTDTIKELDTRKTFEHKYEDVGEYTIRSMITDIFGKKSTTNETISITKDTASTSSWSVSGADLINNTTQENLSVTKEDNDTYSVYTTNWQPNSTSDDYWITYSLTLPKSIFTFENKFRLTLGSKAGELADYDRAITIVPSSNKNISYNFMTNVNNQKGFIREFDFVTSSDIKTEVDSLTDSSLNVRTNARFYAVENSYLGTSSKATISGYKYKDNTYTKLSNTGKSINAQEYLKEIKIQFKGNATINLLLFEYDKNSDGEYSSDEKLVLNTKDMNVDFSSFVVGTTLAFTNSLSVSVKENQTSAITLTATNSDNDNLIYSISGTDASSFNINSTTGVVTFKTAPDFETKSSYTFTASVSDGIDTATKDITIKIIDIDESTNSNKFNIGVLKTGQSTSYADYDDGYYQKGTTRSFTRGSDIVVDQVTGLQWQDNSDVKTIKKPWVTSENYDAKNYSDTSGDTATTYCQNLTLGGYSDWRLPNVKELLSIVDNSKFYPAIFDTFENTTLSYCWSSTTLASNTSSAWTVGFYYGGTDYYSKGTSGYVRCVRDNN